jgi:diadenosine tetraphosphate (Ap4A) HIT family hydrolase
MTPASSADAGCALCAPMQGHPAPAVVVASSPSWIVTVFPPYDVPGWYFFQSRRHVTALGDLDADALSDLGPRLAHVTDAIRSATACPTVYIYRFGETYEHWHTVLCARGDDVPLALRGARLLLERDRFRDDERTAQVSACVATLLSERDSTWSPGDAARAAGLS